LVIDLVGINALQEHRAPWVLFSVWAFSQLQCIAACLPQEQVASLAQRQPPERPQQVTGTVAVEDIVCVDVRLAGWVV